MKILDHVESIRIKVRLKGDYARVADVAGVSDSWLTKFANGKILNPTVDSIDKLERVYVESDDKAQDSPP